MQIEACFNSGPLYPLSTDPSDYIALVSDHFSLGTTLTALPEPDVNNLDKCHLKQASWKWPEWCGKTFYELDNIEDRFYVFFSNQLKQDILIKKVNKYPHRNKEYFIR